MDNINKDQYQTELDNTLLINSSVVLSELITIRNSIRELEVLIPDKDHGALKTAKTIFDQLYEQARIRSVIQNINTKPIHL